MIEDVGESTWSKTRAFSSIKRNHLKKTKTTEKSPRAFWFSFFSREITSAFFVPTKTRWRTSWRTRSPDSPVSIGLASHHSFGLCLIPGGPSHTLHRTPAGMDNYRSLRWLMDQGSMMVHVALTLTWSVNSPTLHVLQLYCIYLYTYIDP